MLQKNNQQNYIQKILNKVPGDTLINETDNILNLINLNDIEKNQILIINDNFGSLSLILLSIFEKNYKDNRAYLEVINSYKIKINYSQIFNYLKKFKLENTVEPFNNFFNTKNIFKFNTSKFKDLIKIYNYQNIPKTKKKIIIINNFNSENEIIKIFLEINKKTSIGTKIIINNYFNINFINIYSIIEYLEKNKIIKKLSIFGTTLNIELTKNYTSKDIVKFKNLDNVSKKRLILNSFEKIKSINNKSFIIYYYKQVLITYKFFLFNKEFIFSQSILNHLDEILKKKYNKNIENFLKKLLKEEFSKIKIIN